MIHPTHFGVRFALVALCCGTHASSGVPQENPPIRVACIGDSITVGSKIAGREHNSYPAQLAHLIGADYEVRNFGVGSSTLLAKADLPFTQTPEWEEVLEWKPDVSIILLGTNDTCQDDQRSNWQHAEHAVADAQAMVSALRSVQQNPRILLCSPTPMFPNASGLSPARKADLTDRSRRMGTLSQALAQVANGQKNVEYHDLARVITQGQVVDGVHLSAFGAESLAERLAEALRAKRGQELETLAKLQALFPKLTESRYHGFQRVDFKLSNSGANCTVVIPHVGLRGRPWLWRMRFFGHEPGLELELLDRGVHLVYVDIAGHYGSPSALARMEELYANLCNKPQSVLSNKPILMGMSRGGLPALHWANTHPKQIAALYADNAVFDLSSWPGGKSTARKQPEWEEALAAWDWDEKKALNLGDHLIPKSQRAAKEGVGLFVSVGLDDQVVPPSENSMRLAAAWERRGGPVQIWRKPNAGHHPHGLHPPAPLRRGLLAAVGHGHNPAAHSKPSAEYRGRAAGWDGGTWWDELARLQSLGEEHSNAQVVFLGDSITQGLSGSKARVAIENDENPFNREFGSLGAVNLGVSGDRTEHLLYRIKHGALSSMNPKVIMLQIGANNVVTGGHSADETAEGIEAVVALLCSQEPQARILIYGPFPVGFTAEDPLRTCTNDIHKRIQALGKLENVLYVDLRRMFLQPNGEPNANMASDAIHISAAGKSAWLSVAYFSVIDSLGR